MEIRKIQEKDIPVIRKWYDEYEGWNAPPLDSLPEEGLGGFVAHNGDKLIASAYLYLTNSKLCHLEWVIRDPSYNEEDKGIVIDELLTYSCYYAKGLGYKYAFACVQHENLIKRYEGIGFTKNPATSHDLILKLQ